MRRPPSVLIACVAVLALAVIAAGCGGTGSSSTGAGDTAASADTTDSTPTGPAPAPAATGCRTVAAPEPKHVDEPEPAKRLARGVTYVVVLRTSCGEIPIRLDAKRQPRTAASFAALVRRGVYDGLSFHRVVPGFVVQGGDPAGNGSGGPGYTITERPPADATYTRGVVAMAKTEVERPGTSGSQFFIVTAQDAQLPPDYALVGKVIDDGMTTADAISSVPTDAQDAPTSPVVIEKATLQRR